MRRANRAAVAGLVLMACSLSPHMHGQASLKARVELLQNGHKVKNASNAVIWLTRLGGMPVEPTPQTMIPRLEQRDKSFHPTSGVMINANENPLGPSPMALAVIKEAAAELHRYPDGNGFALKQALSRHLKDRKSVV